MLTHKTDETVGRFGVFICVTYGRFKSNRQDGTRRDKTEDGRRKTEATEDGKRKTEATEDGRRKTEDGRRTWSGLGPFIGWILLKMSAY